MRIIIAGGITQAWITNKLCSRRPTDSFSILKIRHFSVGKSENHRTFYQYFSIHSALVYDFDQPLFHPQFFKDFLRQKALCNCFQQPRYRNKDHNAELKRLIIFAARTNLCSERIFPIILASTDCLFPERIFPMILAPTDRPTHFLGLEMTRTQLICDPCPNITFNQCNFNEFLEAGHTEQDVWRYRGTKDQFAYVSHRIRGTRQLIQLILSLGEILKRFKKFLTKFLHCQFGSFIANAQKFKKS